jgi:hypothetical protein
MPVIPVYKVADKNNWEKGPWRSGEAQGVADQKEDFTN